MLKHAARKNSQKTYFRKYAKFFSCVPIVDLHHTKRSCTPDFGSYNPFLSDSGTEAAALFSASDMIHRAQAQQLCKEMKWQMAP
jgi:hypothetical protein